MVGPIMDDRSGETKNEWSEQAAYSFKRIEETML